MSELPPLMQIDNLKAQLAAERDKVAALVEAIRSYRDDPVDANDRPSSWAKLAAIIYTASDLTTAAQQHRAEVERQALEKAVAVIEGFDIFGGHIEVFDEDGPGLKDELVKAIRALAAQEVTSDE